LQRLKKYRMKRHEWPVFLTVPHKRLSIWLLQVLVKLIRSAVQLGKALEDPIKGINALRKSGITFTDAEKKKLQRL
jgi:hypothetical protein